MLKKYVILVLERMAKWKILNGLNEAGYWISEVADNEKEKHIKYMLEAIDKAHDYLAQI